MSLKLIFVSHSEKQTLEVYFCPMTDIVSFFRHSRNLKTSHRNHDSFGVPFEVLRMLSGGPETAIAIKAGNFLTSMELDRSMKMLQSQLTKSIAPFAPKPTTSEELADFCRSICATLVQKAADGRLKEVAAAADAFYGKKLRVVSKDELKQMEAEERKRARSNPFEALLESILGGPLPGSREPFAAPPGKRPGEQREDEVNREPEAAAVAAGPENADEEDEDWER